MSLIQLKMHVIWPPYFFLFLSYAFVMSRKIYKTYRQTLTMCFSACVLCYCENFHKLLLCLAHLRVSCVLLASHYIIYNSVPLGFVNANALVNFAVVSIYSQSNLQTKSETKNQDTNSLSFAKNYAFHC